MWVCHSVIGVWLDWQVPCCSSLAWVKLLMILVIVFIIIWWNKIFWMIMWMISGMVFICFIFHLLKKRVISTTFLWWSWLIMKIYWIWSRLWCILTLWKEGTLSICFRFCCFWSIYIVVIMFCKIISMWCLLFVWWFCYWSERWIIHLRIFLSTEGFTVDCMIVCCSVGLLILEL